MELPFDILIELSNHLDDKTKLYLLSTSSLFTKYKSQLILLDQATLTTKLIDSPYFNKCTNLIIDSDILIDKLPEKLRKLDITNTNCKWKYNQSLTNLTHFGYGNNTRFRQMTKVAPTYEIATQEIYDPITTNMKFKFVKTHSIKMDIVHGRRYRIDILNSLFESIDNIVIKNIRISNQHIINKIEIKTNGGYLSERINGKLFDTYRHVLKVNDTNQIPFGILSDDSFIPLCDQLETNLNINIDTSKHIGEPITSLDVEVDFYETSLDISPYQKHGIPGWYDKQLEYVTKSSVCFDGRMPDIYTKYRLRFGTGNIMNLILWFDVDPIIENLKLMLSKDGNQICINPLIEKFNKSYIITFTDSMTNYGFMYDHTCDFYCSITAKIPAHNNMIFATIMTKPVNISNGGLSIN